MKFLPKVSLALLSAAFAATSAQGQTLFSDNFDVDSTANWTVNKSGSDAFADIFFDYSTLGIPSAPNSTGGSTRGIRFLANQSAGLQQGVSASPIGLGLSGDFVLRVDMWLNYVGPLTAGGNGSTQIGSIGIGTTGTTAQWAGSSASIMFGAGTDAGSASAYRAYFNNTLATAGSGVYAAGSLSAANAYYTSRYGGESAPSAQVSLYPNQTGTTPAGTVGFKWRDVAVTSIGNTVTYSIDGSTIATVDKSSLTLSTNIFVGLFDINNGSSTEANDHLTLSLYDNLRVTTVPEPGTMALLAVGVGAVAFGIRRKKS